MQISPALRVYSIGLFIALLATMVAVFVLSLIGAVMDELAMGDFASAAYVAIATFVIGGSVSILMWGAWAKFARYAHKEIGAKLPGYRDE